MRNFPQKCVEKKRKRMSPHLAAMLIVLHYNHNVMLSIILQSFHVFYLYLFGR